MLEGKSVIGYGIEAAPGQEATMQMVIMGFELSISNSGDKSSKSLNVAWQDYSEQKMVNVFGTVYLSTDPLYSINVTAYAICI